MVALAVTPTCLPCDRLRCLSERCLEPSPEPAPPDLRLHGNAARLGLGALRELGADSRLRELARAVADEPDARRVLRPLHELYDALHADREPEPDRHPEDLLGALDHALHEDGPAREDDARADLLDEPSF